MRIEPPSRRISSAEYWRGSGMTVLYHAPSMARIADVTVTIQPPAPALY